MLRGVPFFLCQKILAANARIVSEFVVNHRSSEPAYTIAYTPH